MNSIKYYLEQKQRKKERKLNKMADKFLANAARKEKKKAKRKNWWHSLTPEQQSSYIREKNELKALRRKYVPVKDWRTPAIIKRSPWVVEGVNEGNRHIWFARIISKNPWLESEGLYTD